MTWRGGLTVRYRGTQAGQQELTSCHLGRSRGPVVSQPRIWLYTEAEYWRPTHLEGLEAVRIVSGSH